MRELTFTEAVTLFRKHWNTIAEMTPEEMRECESSADIKLRALGKMGINETVYLHCFCCEYSKIVCDRCIIRWSGLLNTYTCTSGNGEYALFCKAINGGKYLEAAEIARKIANLPAREMMEGEE